MRQTAHALAATASSAPGAVSAWTSFTIDAPAAIARTMAAFACCPSRAPSRSTTWTRRAPSATQRRAIAPGPLLATLGLVSVAFAAFMLYRRRDIKRL